MTPERRKQLLMASRLGQSVLAFTGTAQFYSDDQPRNHGQFAPAGGGGSGSEAAKAVKASPDTVKDLAGKLNARHGETKTSDVNAMMKAAAGLTQAQAKAVWKEMGRSPMGSKADHRRLLVTDIEERQGARLRAGAIYRPGDPRAAVKGHDAELLGADSLLGKKKPPTAKPATAEKPAKAKAEKVAKPTAPAESPTSKQGKAVAGIYDKAATATDKDIATAKEHLATMKPDEVRRVAAAMGYRHSKSESGKSIAAKILDKIEGRRGATIRRGLLDRPLGQVKPIKTSTVMQRIKASKDDAKSRQGADVKSLAGVLNAATRSAMGNQKQPASVLRGQVDETIKSIKTRSGLIDLHSHLTGNTGNAALKSRMAGHPRKKLEAMIHAATTGRAGTYSRSDA